MVESAHTSQTPAQGDVNNGNAITVGATLKFAAAGTVSAIRFWVPATNSGTYTVKLHQVTADDDPAGTGTGTELASASVAAGSVTAGQWASVPITPVAVSASHAYRAAVHCTSGRIVATGAAFASGPISNGNVTLIQSGADPVGLGSLLNGTFTESASPAYPVSSFNATDYFVDVEFTVTPTRNTFEGGTDGVAITAGNSGGASGTAFSAVTVAGTSTLTYDNDHVAHGSLAAKVVAGGSSENAFMALPVAPSGATVLAAQCYLYLPAHPSGNTRIIQFATTGGAGRDAVFVTSAGKLRWDSFTGTDVTGAVTVPTGQWVRVAVRADASGAEVRLFTSPESTTPAEAITGGGPISGDAMAVVRFGWTSAPAGFTAWFDSVEANTGPNWPTPVGSPAVLGTLAGVLPALAAGLTGRVVEPGILAAAAPVARLGATAAAAALAATAATTQLDATHVPGR